MPEIWSNNLGSEFGRLPKWGGPQSTIVLSIGIPKRLRPMMGNHPFQHFRDVLGCLVAVFEFGLAL